MIHFKHFNINILIMKIATITKTGYTASNYGKTNDLFSLQIIEIVNEEIKNFSYIFKWLYGSDYRITKILKDNWFIILFNNSNYWKIKLKEVADFTLTEEELKEEIKNNFLLTI